MNETQTQSDEVLEKRIAQLIQTVESQPEGWYKILIRKLVEQEAEVEELHKRLEGLERYEKFQSAIIDDKLLEAPVFLRDVYEVRATSNLFPDEGFYNMEHSSAGFDFRWTKKDFYFDLPLNRNVNKRFELHLASAIKPELLEGIRCYAEGTEILLSKMNGEKGHVYEGVLPASKTKLNTTRLSFHARTSYSPKEFNPETADTRMLAVTFTKLSVGS